MNYSPEMMLGMRADLDARTDVYALGCTLYYALTGRPPIMTNDLHAYMREVLTKRPRPAHVVDRRVPAGIGRVVSRCLEKESAKRFACAADLASALLSPPARRPWWRRSSR